MNRCYFGSRSNFMQNAESVVVAFAVIIAVVVVGSIVAVVILVVTADGAQLPSDKWQI